MLVLHHPEAAWPLPQPPGRGDRSGGRSLAARGVRELILISQDTTFYGRDLGERARALPTLLRELNKVDGIDWIRLLYLYPTTITDDILDAIAECGKVVKYIDLPLQHAADDVLRRMKRPGTGRNYEKLLARIRERVPGVSLRTTFIVGFPGETETEFEELLRVYPGRRLRPCRRVHLLARRRHDGVRSPATTCLRQRRRSGATR